MQCRGAILQKIYFKLHKMLFYIETHFKQIFSSVIVLTLQEMGERKF